MKSWITCQIDVFSEALADKICDRIRNSIAGSDPYAEDWTGVDQDWPPAPEVYIFFSIDRENFEDLQEGTQIPKKIFRALEGANALVWTEDGEVIAEATPPETVEEHVRWVGVDLDTYQHIYHSRKARPSAVKYKCTSTDMYCHNPTWYSIPSDRNADHCPYCDDRVNY
ncbi:MAG: hypothetical protein HC786_23245 [Richelia sp. CSU_2_1]|nr:hypothetical protein [Richelia sp. CSU_2_1]